jgi:hypothetical protein
VSHHIQAITSAQDATGNNKKHLSTRQPSISWLYKQGSNRQVAVLQGMRHIAGCCMHPKRARTAMLDRKEHVKLGTSI